MINVFEFHTNPEELDIPEFGDNAKLAFDFVQDYLWLDGYHRHRITSKKLEDIIAKSPIYACSYALQVLHHRRFTAGEPAIATNAHQAYTYARYVIEGRFPEAESVIANDAQYSYQYAKDVIKGRWPMCEDNLLHGQGYDHDRSLFHYIEYILKERWPEAESRIIKSGYKAAYEKLFKITL